MKNAKNKEQTKQRLLDAVGHIIKTEGFVGLGVNKVARLAGSSKILIYRYFGDFEQMLKTYILGKDFWANHLAGDAESGTLDLPLREKINKILTEEFSSFYEHCEMEAMLVNEISNDNEMIKKMIRDGSAVDKDAYANIISTLLMAGTDHLILDMKENPKNNNTDSDRKEELQQTINKIIDWTVG